jgi:hypothetical protein
MIFVVWAGKRLESVRAACYRTHRGSCDDPLCACELRAKKEALQRHQHAAHRNPYNGTHAGLPLLRAAGLHNAFLLAAVVLNMRYGKHEAQ